MKTKNSPRNDSSDIQQDIRNPGFQAPDGGWGWIVVLSAWVISILVDGIGFSYGVLLPKFAEHFDAPISKVSLVGSLMIGLYLCFGPIAGGLVNKYGCRTVTIAGSVISAIGVLGGAFSPSLDILIVTYGVIGGIGFGMMYLPSIVCVGLYFDKKRPLATGIAVCGSGIGTFIFSPIIEFLSEIYDWRGVLVIMAGIILNGVVCGMLFRPISPNVNPDDAENFLKRESIRSEASHHLNKDVKNTDKNNTRSCKFYLEETEPFIQITSKINSTEQYIPLKRQTRSENDIINTQTRQPQPTELRSSKFRAIMSVPQIRYHSFANVMITNSEEQINVEQKKCFNMMTCKMEHFTEFFDFSLLRNTSFVLIWIGNIFAASAYVIPFIYIVDRVLLIGISSSNAAWILSIIGIANTVGRVLSGLVGNLKNVNLLLLNNVALLLASISLFLQPLYTIYPVFVIFSTVYGLCIGTFASLSPTILCDLLGVDRLASSFGLLGVARGIACVVGPIVAGMIFQATGNYDASFYTAGGLFFIGAGFHFAIFIPHLPCRQKERVQNVEHIDKNDEKLL